MRGLLTGLLSGAAVSALGLVAGERFIPVVQLQPPAPEAGNVAVPAGSEFNTERPDTPPILPGPEAAPVGADAPVVAAPGPEDDALPDTTPLDAPQAAPLSETALTPPEAAPPPVIVTGDSTDGLPQPGGVQPDAPGLDAGATPETATAVPQTGAVPQGPDAPATEAEPAVETAMASNPPQPPAAPATPAAPVAETDAAPDDTESAALPQPGAAPSSPSDPNAAPEPAVDPLTVEPPPQIGTVPETPSGTDVAVDMPPVAVPEAPQGLRLPVPEIGDMTPGVTTDRLPRIGAEPASEAASRGEPALTANAIPFENPGDSPLIALVLVDVGAVRPDTDVLAAFPVPLTVAIDPTVPDAGVLAQAYRQAGLEVAILAALAEGASPADVEVAFQSFFAAVPKAVAIMDLPEAILQESRPRAVQVIEILAETGHGLVTYEKGLNTGLQVASQSSVPARTVFRDIDPGAHDVAAMKRFLDQAAFKAGLDGRIILKAEVRPETLTALAEWSLGSRAASVVFAPLSAVLKP